MTLSILGDLHYVVVSNVIAWRIDQETSFFSPISDVTYSYLAKLMVYIYT